jgi:heme A synthase
MENVSTGMQHGVLGLHVIMAVIVAAGAIFVGGRAWGTYRHVPVVPRLGGWLIILIGLQFLLGIAALVAIMVRGDRPEVPLLEVALTTAHQMTGALILANAALLAAWTRRLLAPESAA